MRVVIFSFEHGLRSPNSKAFAAAVEDDGTILYAILTCSFLDAPKALSWSKKI
jgi:hypothetical protein